MGLSSRTSLHALEPAESPFLQQLSNSTPIPAVLSWSWEIDRQKCVWRCCTVVYLTYQMCPGVLLVRAHMLQGYLRKYSDPLWTSTPNLLADHQISGFILIPGNNPTETIILLTAETSTGKRTCCFAKLQTPPFPHHQHPLSVLSSSSNRLLCSQSGVSLVVTHTSYTLSNYTSGKAREMSVVLVTQCQKDLLSPPILHSYSPCSLSTSSLLL